jgi:hypothetical protein
VILEAISKPMSNWLIAREELTKLKDTTLLTFFKVLKEYGLKKDEHYYFNDQTKTVQFYTGSIIFFREIKYFPSDPEFDRLGSYDLTGCFLDESQQIHAKAIDVLKGRFSVLSGNGWQTIPKCLYTCNPAKNWIYTDFYKPSRDNEIRPDRVFIKSLATDNPYASKDYIDNLRKADKVTRERLLEGNFEYDDDPSKLCDYEKILDLFTNDFVPKGEKFISADIAFMGSDLFVVGAWDGLRLVEIKTMAKSTGKEVLDGIKELALKHRVPQSNIIFDNDGAGGFLSGWIANAIPFKNNGRALYKENYQHLKAQCEYKLAELVQSAQIYIVDQTYRTQIIEELEALKRDKVDNDGKLTTQSKDKIKLTLGHSPDFLDMIKMRMYFEIYRVAKLS